MPGRERTAVLVLRVWISEEEGLRARIIASEDVSSGAESSIAATDIDDICGIVRDWFEQLAGPDRRAPSPPLTPR